MKKLLLIFVLYFISCSVFKSGKSGKDCLENEKFKKKFFAQIANIKNNISLSQDKTFLNSLIFISNYAPVSFEEMMNYGRTYTIKTLEKDEPKWIEWYQQNKCNNIQLKKNYTVPEKYLIYFEQ